MAYADFRGLMSDAGCLLRGTIRLTAGRSVGGAATSTVIVGAPIVVGIIVGAVTVRVCTKKGKKDSR